MPESVGKQLFLNLAVDSPDGKHFDVPAANINSLWIIEDVSQLVPVCTFVYEETYSEFSELFPLLGNETLTLDMGLNKEKYRSFKFRYVNYQSRPLGAILTRNKEIMINWIDTDFTKLRQYPQVLHYDTSSLSDIARKVASDLPMDVDDSKGSSDYFFHNAVVGEALKELASVAISSDGSTFMFFKGGNKYKFKSRNSLMRQTSKNTFIYGYDLTHFTLFGADQTLYTNPVTDIIGYSYEKGQNFEVNKSVSDVKSKKASFGKNMPYGSGINITPRFSYEGMRNTFRAEGRSVAANEAFMDSSMRIVFTALGQPFISCGDVIDISVGASLPSLGTQNMLISGNWLVEKIVHYVTRLNYQIKIFAAKSNTDFSRRKSAVI